ncbi:MAG: M1 family aminopeptidase [Bryobacterales bacterium]|nr:M1 family aminopeptidase [Bryobacteraceae bacterium]MDW8354834.1 M1 family aminopeptidase [Bryobacterales bacterium]
MGRVITAALLAGTMWAAETTAELARQARELALDPEQCYRVRDLRLLREDIRLYLTDGYLVFARPVNGRTLAAVFDGDVEGGDAEILLLPPQRDERLSLAAATGSPNLNEHFRFAVLIFTDDTYEELATQLGPDARARRSFERGLLLAETWTPALRNLISSFEVRIVQDLLGPPDPSRGFFYAGLSGNTLGNFDVFFDPRAEEQIRVGRVTFREQRPFFEIWTSFPARGFRAGRRAALVPPFTVGEFRLEATLERDLRLAVVTRLKVTPRREGLRALDFDLTPRMQVTRALLEGRPAEIFQRESLRSNLIRGRADDVFLLVAPQPLEVGRSYEVEFHHEGKVVYEAGNRVYYVGSRDNWYPNRPPQFAQYEVVFRYPKELSLVAAGDVIEDRTEGEWRITRRRTGAPIRFVGFNLGDYERVSVTRAGYHVEVCANRAVEPALQPRVTQVTVLPPSPPSLRRSNDRSRALMTVTVVPPPPDPAARLEWLATEVAAALEFMASHFGPPPLSKLTISPIPGAFGQGFPGLVYLSTVSYLEPDARPPAARKGFDELFFSEILHAHETAHQWWGNLVTSASYRDDWLMEALATYSALLHLERRKGAKALEAVLAEYRKRLLTPNSDGTTLESTGPITWGFRLEARSPEAWRVITYEKGAWILHMLRARMGLERFLQMLGELCRRYRYQAISTEQFRALAVEFLPPGSPDPKLESFFDHWVYSTGIPAFEVKTSVRGKPPKVSLTVTVWQTGVRDVGFDVPVEIRASGSRPQIRWVRTDSEPVTFTVVLGQKPSRVLLDPDNTLLAVRK